MREIEIAVLYAGGANYHEVATQLYIAPSTVRSHLATIYRKLGVSSKLALKKRLDDDFARSHPQTNQAAIIAELALRIEEGISREKALSAVLRIISRSDGDLDVVIPEILGYALDLCDADSGILMDYHQNSRFKARFTKGIPQDFQDWFDATGEFTASPQSGLGRISTHKKAVNIVDLQAEKIYPSDDVIRDATIIQGGVRSLVGIPMLAGDELVGAFTIFRHEVRPFTEDIARLACVFADQSVIAINNARLISALRKATHANVQTTSLA